MSRPLVSVAMATYNGEKYLREQLDSICSQTYPNLEVVVSDDCSTDGTVRILDEYRSRPGFQCTVQPSRAGFIKNFESAIASCRGDYIALADQDDIWEPDKIEALLAGIGGRSLVYSDARLIDDRGITIAGSLLHASRVAPVTGHPFRYLVCNACVTGCTALITRDLKDQALPVPDSEPYHDWWLSIAATRLRGIAYVDKPLVRYRQHKNNYAGAYIKRGALRRACARFSRTTREHMRAKNELLLRRTAVFIDSRDTMGLSDGEVNYLIDIHRYAEAMLRKGFSGAVLRLAMRHRRELFSGDRLPVQFVKAVTRAFKM